MKYKKIGDGRVLKCWESKINRFYDGKVHNSKLICKNCNNIIGKVIDDYVKMNQNSFTYTGIKN